jgi:mannose-1-phosphate guanylyltransferase
MNLNDHFIPIVLCAGFGTRLRPLTNYLPKVACPLMNKPFAFYSIEKFFQAGFEIVHCNLHYLSDVVQDEILSACEYFGYKKERIRFWREEVILETGGGISHIQHALCAEDEKNSHKDLIVVSGDVVADFPLRDMILTWQNRKPTENALMCTLAMKDFRKDFTAVSPDGKLVLGFGESFLASNSEIEANRRIFSNHQIISAQLVSQSAIEKKSSVDLFYREVLKEKKHIINLNYPESAYWFNIGTREEYLEAQNYFAKDITGSLQVVHVAFNMPKLLEEDINNSPFKETTLNGEKKIEILFRNKLNALQNKIYF